MSRGLWVEAPRGGGCSWSILRLMGSQRDRLEVPVTPQPSQKLVYLIEKKASLILRLWVLWFGVSPPPLVLSLLPLLALL